MQRGEEKRLGLPLLPRQVVASDEIECRVQDWKQRRMMLGSNGVKPILLLEEAPIVQHRVLPACLRIAPLAQCAHLGMDKHCVPPLKQHADRVLLELSA